MKHLNKYNRLWASGENTKPLVIIVGGAAGTGKTVLSYKLLKDISYANYLTAALIRSLLTLFIPEEQNPYLRKHTFELQKIEKNTEESDKHQLIEKFRQQSAPIVDGIENFLKFLITEKQHYIIEGPNALPRNWQFDKDKLILIPISMKVSDPKMHAKMMGGPTHNRDITEEKMINVRILNDFIVEESEKYGIRVFEYNTNYDEILTYIDQRIGEELRNMGL